MSEIHDAPIDRIIDPTQLDTESVAGIGVMSMLLSAVPSREDRVAGIAVYPGLGETWRVSQAIESWHSYPNAENLLVAGDNPNDPKYRRLDLPGLAEEPFNLTRTEGVLTQVEAFMTPGQSTWLAEQIETEGLESVSLHVAPYHLLRAYCTTLATMRKEGVKPVPIIPVPTRVAPDTVTPSTGADMTTMHVGEMKRIAAYQKKGDVATLPELETYLNWLWQQPILAKS